MKNRRLIVEAFGGPEVVRVVPDASAPTPGVGEVRIRVEASSLVFTDMLIRRDLYPVMELKLPLTLGYDLIGRIDAVGEGVTAFSPGDRVADLTQIGANADYVCRPAEGLVAVPDGLDAVQAEPLILSYLTAYQSLLRFGKAARGDTVLIYGASGGVGLAALDLCRALGINAVGVASAQREALIRGYGARFVAYDNPNAARQLDQIAREIGGFAAILDPARGERLGIVLARLKPRGRFVAAGFSAALRRAKGQFTGLTGLIGKIGFGLQFLTVKIKAARSRKTGRVLFYDISETRQKNPDWFHEDLTALFGMLSESAIHPLVEGVFKIDEAAEAHRRIEAGDVQGRLVMDLSDK